MSTKVFENCPACGKVTFPTDKLVVVKDKAVGDLPLRLWRYSCECGWTWANLLQREHNGHEYNRMWQSVNGGMYS